MVMSNERAQQLRYVEFAVSNGGRRGEPFDALKYGDVHRQMKLSIEMKKGSTGGVRVVSKAKLRVDTLTREDNSGDRWTFKGQLQAEGRWINVEGALDLRGDALGTMRAIPEKACSGCIRKQHRTEAVYCDACGSRVVLREIPDITSFL
jgi:hypothetical protein